MTTTVEELIKFLSEYSRAELVADISLQSSLIGVEFGYDVLRNQVVIRPSYKKQQAFLVRGTN